MDLRQLEHFVAVAEERHFTRAASRLNIVQSGLSASIRALEEEMGAPLFLRTTRRVNLTSAGQAFLEEANRVLAAAKVARNVVVELQGLRRGRLKIGAIQGLAPFIDLPKLLGDFHREFPNVEILLSLRRYRRADRWRARRKVRSRLHPIRRGAARRNSPPACWPATRWSSPAPKTTRSPGGKICTFAEIAQEAFIDLPSGHGTRQLVDHCFAEAGLHRKSKFEVNDLTMQLDMVAHGLGVALVPRTCGAKPRPRGVCVRNSALHRWPSRKPVGSSASCSARISRRRASLTPPPVPASIFYWHRTRARSFRFAHLARS